MDFFIRSIARRESCWSPKHSSTDRTGLKKLAPTDGRSFWTIPALRTSACRTITAAQTFSRPHSIRTWDYFLLRLMKRAPPGKQSNQRSRSQWACGFRAEVEAWFKGTINSRRFARLIQPQGSGVGNTSTAHTPQVLL